MPDPVTPNPSSPAPTPTASQSSPSSTPPEDGAVAAAFGETDDEDISEAADDAFLASTAEGDADDATVTPSKPTPAATPAPSSAPAPASAAAPTPSPAPAAAQPATPAAQAPAQPTQPVQAQPAAQPSQPQAPQTQPAQDWPTLRKAHVDKLANTNFKLDPKELEDVGVDNEAHAKVLSRLAAEAVMTSIESTTEAIRGILPSLIHQVLEQRKQSDGIIDRFTSAFPALKDHMDKVLPIAQSFRAVNPQATLDDTIKHVGELAHITLGIAKPTAAPAAASVPATVQRQVVPPFQPVIGAAPAAPARAPASQNPFTALAEQDLRGLDDED